MQGIVNSATASIEKVDQLRKTLEALSKDPEKNKLLIQEIQKQLSATLPLAVNCTPT
jgi:hypothetical protein